MNNEPNDVVGTLVIWTDCDERTETHSCGQDRLLNRRFPHLKLMKTIFKMENQMRFVQIWFNILKFRIQGGNWNS